MIVLAGYAREGQDFDAHARGLQAGKRLRPKT